MKHHFRPLKAIAAIVMALCLVVASPTMFGTETAVQAKTEQQKLDDLKDQEKALEKKINDLENQKKDTETLLAPLIEKVQNMQDQLDILKKKISDLDTKIKEMTQKIAGKQAELDQQYAAFSQRMVTVYQTGAPSKLEAFLTASDFSEYLLQAEMISTITKEDNAIMDNLKKQTAEIKKQKASLDQQKKDLLASKEDQEKKQKEVEASVAVINEKLKALAKETGKAGDLLSSNRADQEKIEQSIQDQIKNSNYTDGDGNVTGNMIWPMPGYSMITTYFNKISGYNGRNHGGIDIAGSNIYGKNIVAADGGTVITAYWGHYSYGNYVMIDHHNGLVTLYAHSSKLLVKTGQAVTKGQAIAEVGSTGESSGPHLHFEVRKNGVRVDPFNYVHY